MLDIKNKSAYFEYYIEAKFEAGIVLLGTEVKGIRKGKVSFNDSFCTIIDNEVWLKSLHISEYSHGNINNHNPVRDRKILLHAKEIKKISNKIKEQGYTIVPLRLFEAENNFLKIEIGLAKGKKLHDKRDSIKQRDQDREMKSYIK